MLYFVAKAKKAAKSGANAGAGAKGHPQKHKGSQERAGGDFLLSFALLMFERPPFSILV